LGIGLVDAWQKHLQDWIYTDKKKR